MLLNQWRSATLSRLELRAVPPEHSGIATDPMDKVTVIIVQYQMF
jgi:hypothetical protein